MIAGIGIYWLSTFTAPYGMLEGGGSQHGVSPHRDGAESLSASGFLALSVELWWTFRGWFWWSRRQEGREAIKNKHHPLGYVGPFCIHQHKEIQSGFWFSLVPVQKCDLQYLVLIYAVHWRYPLEAFNTRNIWPPKRLKGFTQSGKDFQMQHSSHLSVMTASVQLWVTFDCKWNREISDKLWHKNHLPVQTRVTRCSGKMFPSISCPT